VEPVDRYECVVCCSYSELSDIVDHLFPPCQQSCSDDTTRHASCLPGASEYSSFTYWRTPLADVDDEVSDFINTRDASAVVDKNLTDTKKPQTVTRKAASLPPAPAT